MPHEIEQISLGFAHTHILTKDGKLFAAGLNLFGQLGIGNTINQNRFVPVKLGKNIKKICKIFACFNRTFIVDNEGALYTTGICGVYYVKAWQKYSINFFRIEKVNGEVLPKVLEVFACDIRVYFLCEGGLLYLYDSRTPVE